MFIYICTRRRSDIIKWKYSLCSFNAGTFHMTLKTICICLCANVRVYSVMMCKLNYDALTLWFIKQLTRLHHGTTTKKTLTTIIITANTGSSDAMLSMYARGFFLCILLRNKNDYYCRYIPY